MCSKPLSLWYFAMAALEKAYTASLCFLLPNVLKMIMQTCNHSRVWHADEDLGLDPTATRDPLKSSKQVNTSFVECKQTCNTCQITFIQADRPYRFLYLEFMFLITQQIFLQSSEKLVPQPKVRTPRDTFICVSHLPKILLQET